MFCTDDGNHAQTTQETDIDIDANIQVTKSLSSSEDIRFIFNGCATPANLPT